MYNCYICHNYLYKKLFILIYITEYNNLQINICFESKTTHILLCINDMSARSLKSDFHIPKKRCCIYFNESPLLHFNKDVLI